MAVQLEQSEIIRGSTSDIGEENECPVSNSPLWEVLVPEIIVSINEIASQFSHPSYYWNKGPIILTERGTLLWALHCNICVEMTTDQAFRITDINNNTVIAVSPQNDSCLLLGNSGAIFTTKDDIEVTAYEQRNKNDKYSKFNVKEKEITFSSRESTIAYTLNEGGVGSRVKKSFNPIYQDFSYDILNQHGNIGKQYEVDAIDICSRAKYAFTPQCTQIWRLNGVRISYSYNCELQVETTTPEMKVSISSNGSSQIKTPNLLITSSQGNHPHLYVKKDGLRLFYDGVNYINRSGSQAAGFNRFGLMRIFSPVLQNSPTVHP